MKNLLVGALMMMTTIGMILGSSNDAFACGKCGNEKNHQAIVVVSFGTTFDEAREKCIESVENKITEMFPFYEVRRAFTSNIVMKRLAEKGIMVDGSNLPTHSVGSELYSFTIPYADVIDEYGEYELPVPFAVTAGTKYCFYLAPWDVAGDVYSDDYQDVRGISSVSGGVKEITYNGGWSTEEEFRFLLISRISIAKEWAKMSRSKLEEYGHDKITW